MSATAPEGAQTTRGMGVVALVWMVLLALTIGTWWAWTLDLDAWALPVAVLIATTKAGLILIVFMRLGEHGGASRVSMLVAAIFLLLLGGLVWADVVTRFEPTVPPGPLMPELKPGQPALQPWRRTTTRPAPLPSQPARGERGADAEAGGGSE